MVSKVEPHDCEVLCTLISNGVLDLNIAGGNTVSETWTLFTKSVLIMFLLEISRKFNYNLRHEFKKAEVNESSSDSKQACIYNDINIYAGISANFINAPLCFSFYFQMPTPRRQASRMCPSILQAKRL